MTTTVARPGRWRVAEGEEARLAADGSEAATICSRGPLPLRLRREALHHARPAFSGTAVVLGEATYEVVGEEKGATAVVYRLRPWPEGEIVRDRVVYGPAFVHGIEGERDAERLRSRVRRWRFALYPLVGLLPEEPQARACERLGLYAVSATLVSGLCESAGVLMLLALVGRGADPGRAVALLLAAPALIVLVLPGLGRAFGAVFLNESGGSPLVAAVFALRGVRSAAASRPPSGCVPLTRAAFWRRLATPDDVDGCNDGRVSVRGALPHVGWEPGRRLLAGVDYWQVEEQLPRREGSRLLYEYRLVPLGDAPGPHRAGPTPPAPSAYEDAVMGAVRLEWDAFNEGFRWLTSLLAADVQARAFDHRGGPAAARRATLATAAASAALGAYLLHFLPGPAGDPLAPAIGVAGVVLSIDAARRAHAVRQSRYAPSLLRFLLPSNVLRPERLAYQAHRDAERELLQALATR